MDNLSSLDSSATFDVAISMALRSLWNYLCEILENNLVGYVLESRMYMIADRLDTIAGHWRASHHISFAYDIADQSSVVGTVMDDLVDKYF